MALTKTQVTTLKNEQDAFYAEKVLQDEDPDGKVLEMERCQYQQVLRSETDGSYEIHCYDGPDGQGCLLLEWRNGDTEYRCEVLRGTEQHRAHDWQPVPSAKE